MPVLNAAAWILIGVAAMAFAAVFGSAVQYIRAASQLYALVREIGPGQFQAMRDNQLFTNDPGRLDILVLGWQNLDIADPRYRKLLRSSRISIAICGIAFFTGLIVLGVIFQGSGFR